MNRSLFLVVGFSILCAGCASISVQPGANQTTQTAPDRVYVEGFDVSTGDFRVDREGAELADFKNHLQAMMTAGITTDLTKRLIPAEAANGAESQGPQRAWLIRGEFARVNQGSRLLRGAVGFGAGATKLVCRVSVFDLESPNPAPFLTFNTTGGSNAEPGAITALTTDPVTLAIEVAAGGAGNVAHGLTEDTKRTAREITAQLSDYLYHHGWISKDKWVKPKIDKA